MKENQKETVNVKAVCTVNVKGLICPLSLIKVKRKLSKISDGEIIRVKGMEEYFLKDFTAWCIRNNHSLIEKKENYGSFDIFIKKE